MQTLHAIVGFASLMALAWLLSEARSRVPWRLVAGGIALAFVLAVLLLRVSWINDALGVFNRALDAMQAATERGTSFVFGYVGGGTPPFAVTNPPATFVLAFKALPLVLVVGALSALLYYWRILPAFVRAFSWLLEKSLGLGGAVAVSAAANVYVGMVEAPMVIRPYLARLSRGELFVVMNVGMATLAGTVLFLYATVLTPTVPNATVHLLTASLVATPVSIAVAALMVPPEHTPAAVSLSREDPSAMAALVRGTFEALQLLLNIVALLLVCVALVALVNAGLSLLPGFQGAPITLERLFGFAFAPLAWASGVPWHEAAAAGQLLGKKIVLNELVAYFELASLPAETLSPRSRTLMTYALAGFANFGSLGILLGGMSTMLPAERRAELAQLGWKSVWAGLISTCATAALVGVLV
jgi:CNT family concentrative nucleoside transporter